MSRGERKTMITRDRPGLSLSRQCGLLSISRSSFYYLAKGESQHVVNLAQKFFEIKLDDRIITQS